LNAKNGTQTSNIEDQKKHAQREKRPKVGAKKTHEKGGVGLRSRSEGLKSNRRGPQKRNCRGRRTTS